MKQRTRIYYSEAQKSEMWERWQNGESMHEIARSFDRYHSSIQGIISRTGGIRPRERTRSPLSLTLSERESISRGIASELSIRAIAQQLERSPSTICREINRNAAMIIIEHVKLTRLHGIELSGPSAVSFHLINC